MIDDDSVVRVDCRLLSVQIDGAASAVVTLRTDLKTALEGLVQSVGRDCTVALIVRNEPVGS